MCACVGSRAMQYKPCTDQCSSLNCMSCCHCNLNQVRDQSNLLDKVQVVGGDISLPGLGLDEQMRQVLASTLHFIMHCAADIRLEADIQVGFCSCQRLELQGYLPRQACTHCKDLAICFLATPKAAPHTKHAARLSTMLCIRCQRHGGA